MTKPIAKSLHTITVLVRVARDIKARHPERDTFSAVYAALDLLGLGDMPDDHGLVSATLKQLGKSAKY